MFDFPVIDPGDPIRISASLFVAFQQCPDNALARLQGEWGPESRAAFRHLLNLGFTDALLARNPNPGYTFWDYQAGAWERNNGIRIDHLLLSPQAADLLTACQIDKQVRAGDKPSDHVPIWVDLAV